MCFGSSRRRRRKCWMGHDQNSVEQKRGYSATPQYAFRFNPFLQSLKFQTPRNHCHPTPQALLPQAALTHAPSTTNTYIAPPSIHQLTPTPCLACILTVPVEPPETHLYIRIQPYPDTIVKPKEPYPVPSNPSHPTHPIPSVPFITSNHNQRYLVTVTSSSRHSTVPPFHL